MKNLTTEQLIKELTLRGYLRTLWHRDDVEGRLNEVHNNYTEQDVVSICESIERRWDASVGVNWDVIDAYIEMHFE